MRWLTNFYDFRLIFMILTVNHIYTIRYFQIYPPFIQKKCMISRSLSLSLYIYIYTRCIWCFLKKSGNLSYAPRIYVMHSIRFQTFFVQAFKIVVDSWKFSIHLIRWRTNFYDFSFKWTATAAIGIHPTKPWLSQLVNFKNAIGTWGHFRRIICNQILF